MYATEEYEINRMLLEILGLWPYQQSYFAEIRKVFFVSTLSAFIIVQLLAFTTTQYSTNLLLKILSLTLPILFCIAKYYIFIIQADAVKQMLERIQDNWRMLKNKLEVDIVEKHSYIARFLTIILMGFCCFGLIMYTLMQFFPIILDIVIPLNESRLRRSIFITEYFIDQEKYMYAILLHYILALIIAIAALGSVTLIIITYALHISALLNIASYRMENAIEWSILAISSPTREYLLCQRIIHAVTLHRRTSEFIKFFQSKFMVFFAVLIIIGVSSLSLNLFQFLRLIKMNKNIIESMLHGALIFIHLAYMFLINYVGQILIDRGKMLFKATYNGMWYAAPLHTQKLLLFIMQKATVNMHVGYGNTFIASLEGFATLVNAAVSYFTVIYSTGQKNENN
ncbi:Odorant receptor 335 [Nylanderia fulva]|uniref:Odorant receptor n=1 Tax=Nylanderia fulva TaxID=613905 RepID=A0A6G1LP74_9HYME|nr:Odorant receptor 335 [Nylanderia fulva]